MNKESRIEKQLNSIIDGTTYSERPRSRIEQQLQDIIDKGIGGGGGNSITVDSVLSTTSENPVQNKVITAKIKEVEESIPEDITVDNALSETSENPVQNKVITTELASKAPTNSPTFTGTPEAPTADIQSNTDQLATTAFVKAVVNALVNGAPETLDTLKELADAIQNNEDVVAALNAAIGDKADKDNVVNAISGGLKNADGSTQMYKGNVLIGVREIATISTYWPSDIFTDSNGDLAYTINEKNSLYDFIIDMGSNIFTLVGAINEKLNITGGEISGELILNQYMTLKAWIGYGSGEAKAWYNGNTKTIDFEGNVTDIDLNATSASKLKTPRSIRTNLENTTAKYFDGTSNIEPGVTGILSIANGGTGNSNGIVSSAVRADYLYKMYSSSLGDKSMTVSPYPDNDYMEFLFTNEDDDEYYYQLRFGNNPSFLAEFASDLGNSTWKWRNIYGQNGVIQTSDKNEKNSINDISIDKATSLIYGLAPKTYRMNEGTSNRTHWGMISQDVEELLEELGWSSLDFAGFIKSPKMTKGKFDRETHKWIEEPEVIEGEYLYSLRYDEFIPPIIKVEQSHNDRLVSLETKIEERDEIIKNQTKTISDLEARISKLEALLTNS